MESDILAWMMVAQTERELALHRAERNTRLEREASSVALARAPRAAAWRPLLAPLRVIGQFASPRHSARGAALRSAGGRRATGSHG